MYVLLIYECEKCDRQSKVPIEGVSVKESLQLEKRLPEGWTIHYNGKETYRCAACTKEDPSVTTAGF